MDDRAVRQLDALGEVARTFDSLGIDYRLFGGWAVDFYVRSVTRVHDDVDFAVRLADAAQIAQMLADAGWRHSPHPDGDGGTGYEPRGVGVELTFLVDDGVEVLLPLCRGPHTWDVCGCWSRSVRASLTGAHEGLVTTLVNVTTDSRSRRD